ncbi:uncharacterized protein LOC142335532 [Convolutriloba macropyga]|uniref:uncharacterized protein LOC142335532 n=1 Tax=Convolutriloba macropyga TaxID=536237 RepID=UPI003F51CDAB
MFPTMGLGGHTVAPGGVIISRVHPMQPQQRSVIGVATNGSYLKPAAGHSGGGGGSVASSAVGSSGCSSVGGGAGGDSSHDINGFLATTNDTRVPLMYYANISNQPQQNATTIHPQININKQHKQPQGQPTAASTTTTDTGKLIKSHPGGQPGTEFEMTNILNNHHNHQKSSTGTILPVPTYDIA